MLGMRGFRLPRKRQALVGSMGFPCNRRLPGISIVASAFYFSVTRRCWLSTDLNRGCKAEKREGGGLVTTASRPHGYEYDRSKNGPLPRFLNNSPRRRSKFFLTCTSFRFRDRVG